MFDSIQKTLNYSLKSHQSNKLCAETFVMQTRCKSMVTIDAILNLLFAETNEMTITF